MSHILKEIEGLTTLNVLIQNGVITLPKNTEGVELLSKKNTLTIHVKKGVNVSDPLYITHSVNEAMDVKINIEISLEEDAYLDVIELSYLPYKKTIKSEVNKKTTLKNGATLNYYTVAIESGTTQTISKQTVDQGGGSSFTHYDVTLNTGKSVHTVEAILNGEHARSEMFGLYLTNDKNSLTNKVIARHMSPHTYSNQLYKGVLDDKSRAAFDGMIYVEKNCEKIEANQLNKNILSTDTVEITSSPKLEIYTDDVVCNHGAVSGQLDEEALFYMQARGISKEKARELLKYAFASEIIQMIKLAPLGTQLLRLLSPRLKESCHHIFKS